MTDLRYELKFTGDGRLLPQVRIWLRLHPEGFRVAYPPRQVNNLYFDTPDLDSFNANLAGATPRQKLRLRWYGRSIGRADQPILELKFKDGQLGGKRRAPLDLALDLARPFADLLIALRTAVPPDWRPRLQAVQPTLLNYYQRDYLVSPDGRLRATIDHGPAAYDQRLAIRPNIDRPLRLPDLLVIELKAPPGEADRLAAAAARLPIPRSRNSKYVNGLLAA